LNCSKNKNTFQIEIKKDISFIKRISRLKNESLTLRYQKVNPKLKIGYQTFLIRSCYFLHIGYKAKIHYPEKFRESIYYYIKYLIKKILLKRNNLHNINFINNIKYLADLRQYYQNLFITKKIVKRISDHDREIICTLSNFLLRKDLDSSQTNLWEYSSWLSHIIFFTKIDNSQVFEKELVCDLENKFNELIHYLITCLENSNSANFDEIAGAFMKVSLVTCLEDESIIKHFDNANYNKINEILLTDSTDACVFFNKIAFACLFEIEKKYSAKNYAIIKKKFITEARDFSKLDGGYSFFKNYSQNMYYGTKIKSYKKCPDLHGTAMFLWAESLLRMGLNRKSLLNDLHHVKNYKTKNL
jgi:hypothetical protein